MYYFSIARHIKKKHGTQPCMKCLKRGIGDDGYDEAFTSGSQRWFREWQTELLALEIMTHLRESLRAGGYELDKELETFTLDTFFVYTILYLEHRACYDPPLSARIMKKIRYLVYN